MSPILFHFGRFQIYAYGFFIVAGFVLEKRKSFDGQIFFLFLYSITRFLVEIFRGDPRGFFFADLLSTSQAIGILLAIFSLFMLFYIRRQARR